jgi:hypothetical protein
LDCFTRPSLAASRSKLEREQHYLVDTPLVFSDGRSLEGLEDFARRWVPLSITNWRGFSTASPYE